MVGSLGELASHEATGPPIHAQYVPTSDNAPASVVLPPTASPSATRPVRLPHPRAVARVTAAKTCLIRGGKVSPTGRPSRPPPTGTQSRRRSRGSKYRVRQTVPSHPDRSTSTARRHLGAAGMTPERHRRDRRCSCPCTAPPSRTRALPDIVAREATPGSGTGRRRTSIGRRSVRRRRRRPVRRLGLRSKRRPRPRAPRRADRRMP